MNNSYSVSAIITTYKRPVRILKRAIQSVLNQTYENIEIIVVNDCPENKLLVEEISEMIKYLGSNKIQYIVLEKNCGACKARNVGIENSKGEYIALLDDDDEWLPTKLEKQIEGFTDSNIGMVYSPYFNIDLNSNKKQRISLCTDSGNLLEKLLWKNCIGGCSMPLIKKEVFKKCGMFDETFPSSQDYDMWVRIAKEYKIMCVNEPLTIRYLQPDSISVNRSKKDKGFDLFMNKYKELYYKYPKALNYRLIRKASKHIELGNFKEAFKFFKKAIKAKKISKYNIIEPIKGIIKYVKSRYIKRKQKF